MHLEIYLHVYRCDIRNRDANSSSIHLIPPRSFVRESFYIHVKRLWQKAVSALKTECSRSFLIALFQLKVFIFAFDTLFICLFLSAHKSKLKIEHLMKWINCILFDLIVKTFSFLYNWKKYPLIIWNILSFFKCNCNAMQATIFSTNKRRFLSIY